MSYNRSRVSWVKDANGESMPTIRPQQGTTLARELAVIQEAEQAGVIFDTLDTPSKASLDRIWAAVHDGMDEG